jgi:hypothetical protein
MTQAEEVEIVMRLEATLGGTETSTRLVQVQSQLANLTIQIPDMAKTKVVHENIWYTTFLSVWNHRDECPSFQIMWKLVHRVHFHQDNHNGMRFASSGAIFHLTIPNYRNIRQQITPHFVSFVNL